MTDKKSEEKPPTKPVEKPQEKPPEKPVIVVDLKPNTIFTESRKHPPEKKKLED